MRTSRLLVIAACVLPLAARAQAPADTLDLTGRSNLEFGIGLLGFRDASVTARNAGAHANGEIASFSFAHWVRPGVAAEISTAVIGANANLGFGGAASNVIAPILVGLRYSPSALALSRSIRPYVSLAAGPYIHSRAGVGKDGATALTETAAGARLGAGANVFLSSHFLLAIAGDYHAVGHFDHIDTATSGANGFGVSVVLGVTWGGR